MNISWYFDFGTVFFELVTTEESRYHIYLYLYSSLVNTFQICLNPRLNKHDWKIKLMAWPKLYHGKHFLVNIFGQNFRKSAHSAQLSSEQLTSFLSISFPALTWCRLNNWDLPERLDHLTAFELSTGKEKEGWTEAILKFWEKILKIR